MLSEAKFTPGPWKMIRSGPHVWIRSEGPLRTVFDSEAPNEWPLSEADARVIIAAPDLLKALQEILATEVPEDETWKFAEMAVAKALGT